MLDVDKVADAVLAVTREMIAKEIAPLRAENERLTAECSELSKRLDAVSRDDETEQMIDKAIAAIPAPEPVELPDIAAMIAEAMPEAVPGKDGLSIAEVKQNDDGELIVKMTNGETINAGAVRGAAGIGFDDMAVEYDGERALTLRFEKGDDIREFAMCIPAFIDRGVWDPGEYAKGDTVTWGGSLWIAQESTEDKPGVSKSWRLAVKKGRDGKPTVRAD